jgi:hypothetical protein
MAASDNMRARNTPKRLSTSSSISRKVALGCRWRHSAIPLMISSLINPQPLRISSPFMLPPFLSPLSYPFPRKNGTHPFRKAYDNLDEEQWNRRFWEQRAVTPVWVVKHIIEHYMEHGAEIVKALMKTE